ncbi:uncharacterized protein BXIN_1843 [Babesia sp. Xinjiang]|uniref:uncharacterized protein n=1 Tax=Babesia sp. Xinjiang TaxID=462227 RepID=UPI000A262FF8|nr:uncharacterized protein BXIN_1843 [Babesia sp. Xinjiang]ORM40471.1 hypothetical protein BXIN_1843 [Babesia sp. Xinjiang]
MANGGIDRRLHADVAACSGFALPLRSRQENIGQENTEKALWISFEELKTKDSQLIRDIFTNERARMKYWVMLALAFRNAGRIEQFEEILTEMEKNLNEKHKGEPNI